MGPDVDEENHESWTNDVPEHVYRVVSDEDYRQSLKRGYMRSDERNNWKAQAAEEGRDPRGVPNEGTVGGRWAEVGYMHEEHPAKYRIVQFRAAAHPGWEVHPHVPEGDYIRSEHEIPMSTVLRATPPISRSGFETFHVDS